MKEYFYKGIKLLPGMGIYINDLTSGNLFIIFPIENDLAVIAYGKITCWYTLYDFLDKYKYKIVAISDISSNNALGTNIIKTKKVITKKEIAEMFNVNVEDLEII